MTLRRKSLWHDSLDQLLSRLPRTLFRLAHQRQTQTNAKQPYFLTKFNIKDQNVGYWVGVCSATMSIVSGLTAPLWGQQSDRRGRRPAFVLATFVFLMSALVFGFAPALWTVLLVMGLVGFATGVTPVLQYVAVLELNYVLITTIYPDLSIS